MPFFPALLAIIQPIISWLATSILPWMLTTMMGMLVTRIVLIGAYFIAADYAAHALLNILTSNLGLLPPVVKSTMDYFGITTGLNLIISAILFKKTLNVTLINAVH
jgi:hypothetical protein